VLEGRFSGQEVIRVSRLDRLLEIYGDEQAALDAFWGIHPSARSTHRDVRMDAFGGQQFEGTVQGQLLGVIGRDAAPDEDPPPVLLHDQVPNLVVRRPMDLGLDQFNEGRAGPYHSWISGVTMADWGGTSLSCLDGA